VQRDFDGSEQLWEEKREEDLENQKPQRLSSSTAPGKSDDTSIQSAVAPVTAYEHFVDAEMAAMFLQCSRKHVLRLSRLGVVPAHPISFGRRITWRYLLSELYTWVLNNAIPIRVATNSMSSRKMSGGSPRKGGR
jgi:hypothetical protein